MVTKTHTKKLLSSIEFLSAVINKMLLQFKGQFEIHRIKISKNI